MVSKVQEADVRIGLALMMVHVGGIPEVKMCSEQVTLSDGQPDRM